jgi:hypothetical protein
VFDEKELNDIKRIAILTRIEKQARESVGVVSGYVRVNTLNLSHRLEKFQAALSEVAIAKRGLA